MTHTADARSVESPFHADDSSRDADLVARALDGDASALRELVTRHQPFVHAIALKMFGNRTDAEDLTQEVMVKVITSLRSFRGESALRTWLYRITANHFLKTRRRGVEREVTAFEPYFEAVAAMPDEEPEGADEEIGGKTTEELRLRCTSGMLMCLDRVQRITFILGALFEVSHTLGAEILGTSPANFRVRLHRARKDLYSWMNDRCGLVNTANPCRCHKKTRAQVRAGAVDPTRLVFNADYLIRIEDLSRRGAANAMEAVDELHERVFLSHPLHVTKSVIDEILANDAIRTFFDLA